MILIRNFTELYNTFKSNPTILNTSPKFHEFITTVDMYKSTCFCSRPNEKQRLKNDCEFNYKSLIQNEISANINIFKSALNDNSIKFLSGDAMLKEF